MAYEKEKKTVVHFGPILAKGPEGTKGAYDYTLKDHYVRTINILKEIAFVKKCVKEVLKLKGDLDTEVALDMIKQSENKKRVIKFILKHLAYECLDEKKLLKNFSKYKESLERDIKNVETTFQDTDKFIAGSKTINKQECIVSINKALNEIENCRKIFEYIDAYNKEQESGITV